MYLQPQPPVENPQPEAAESNDSNPSNPPADSESPVRFGAEPYRTADGTWGIKFTF